jgi:hypothetical protein
MFSHRSFGVTVTLLTCLTASVVGQSLSPLATSSETAALGALSISRQALSPSAASAVQSLPHAYSPGLPRTSYSKYPWKTDIVATVFWVGETPTENNPTPNHCSSWDTSWMSNYGGLDDPDPAKRAPDFRPVNFVPRQNPFYVALPYNDVVNSSTTKEEASKIIPWFKQAFKREGQSVCRDRWIAVKYQDRICYAQWSDCGPFVTDDAQYVFGSGRPTNTKNKGAGIDISPAVRDYLSFKAEGKCDWRFVDLHEVPDGPWRSFGNNNHFVKTKAGEKDVVANRLDELRRQRDEWFRKSASR